ncbi:tetratricopeptide repeat protein [Motiliproteus sediminis]|uniref:tetratricopeptide repeat protein n=1 Tax=Motiliproteus sediminis TaxID=1468178 RepID=UPI001AEFC688
MNEIDQWLRRGLAAHQQGRADEASRCYAEVLTRKPRHPDALHLSGVLALQRGDLKQAEKLIQRAIKANPNVADFHSNLGEVLRQGGQPAAARRALLQALKLQPKHPLCLNNLGLVAGQLNQPDEAESCFRKALRLRADYFEAQLNLGQLLARQGRNRDALEPFRQAAALRPDFWPLRQSWGNALRQMQRYQEALEQFDIALQLSPNAPALLVNRGECLLRLGQLDAAAEVLQQALARDAGLAAAHNTLGVVRMEQGDQAAARAAVERALELEPGLVTARLNLAQLLREQRLIDDALRHYDQALQQAPELPEAHFGRAMALLLTGRWQEGWAAYEWRFASSFQPELPTLPTPKWTGHGSGRTLVLSEQGLGDNLLGWRWLSQAAEQCGELLLQVPPPLATLARQLAGVACVVTTDQPLPDHDYHCGLLSLPHLLNSAPDRELPQAYLSIEDNANTPWRQRLTAAADGQLKVGLCWAGSALNPKNRQRRLGLEPLLPLLVEPGVCWVSLQKEVAPDDGELLQQSGVQVLDWMAECDDFAATAALVGALDLVISLDSAVAHLAGAMGKPCWTLVPYYHDWRWQLNGDEALWYPHMRLFRQPAGDGDWTSVVAQLDDALRKVVATGLIHGKD